MIANLKTIKDIFSAKCENQKCNHRIKSKYNTLELIPTLKMIFPIEYKFKCTKCNKILTFSQNEYKEARFSNREAGDEN